MGRAGIAGAAAAALAALLAVVLLVVAIGSSTPATSGASAGMACAPEGWAPGQPLDGFGPRELANATAIVQAGAEMGMPEQAQVIAVATAIQESRLLVLGNPAVPGSMHPPPQGVGRDHDSVGLFGQRGTGWGPLAVRMDPRGSARLFYQRLRGIPHWQRLPLTQAADAVQHSALPTAYEQWEPVARRIVGAVSGVSCGPGAGAGAAPDGSLAAAVAARALATVGTPYVWGGGDAHGPDRRRARGARAAGRRVRLLRADGVRLRRHRGQRAAPDPGHLDGVRPADHRPASAAARRHALVQRQRPAQRHPPRGPLPRRCGGGGRMVHAPRTGVPVTVVDNVWQSSYYAGQFIGAVRAVPAAAPTTVPAPRILP